MKPSSVSGIKRLRMPSKRSGERKAKAPSVTSEAGEDRDCRQQPQVRRDVPVRSGVRERGKPAQRVQAQDLVEDLLRLLLKSVVQGARGHRAEDEGFDRADT